MADERKISAVEIDRLYDFLDGLQASGYTIDPRQYLVLSDLLMALIARGDSLDELPLKTLIAPLICSTPAEQQDFYQRFDRWYITLARGRNESSSSRIEKLTTQLLEDLEPRDKRFLNISRQTSIWLIVTFVAVILFIFVSLNSDAKGINPNYGIVFYAALIMFISFAGWLGWQVWMLYQENQYITRELADQEPVYTKVPVKGYVQEIMPDMQFKPIVSALRRRTQSPSTEVDVDRTIENALNRDNWLEIVYRQRQVMPEYVVLIDRKNHLDQQARFVQEVLTKLATDGVWLHQYEFSGDPRVCFPLDRKDIPLRLKDLQSRHPDARLLVFSGMNELINPLTGLLQDWLESLSLWQERAILTPDKLQKVLLEELQSRDFAVLPMTFDGLAFLVRAFETNNPRLLTNDGAGLPAPLTERPMRWTGRDALPESEVQALVNDVKTYLGENGFYWLCATAVYPELRWELTLHLGSTLKDDLGQALLNPGTLLRLARLPWFRSGVMPDWIRLAIISRLTPTQEESVRATLHQLLSSTNQGKEFDLIFSRRRPDSLRARAGKLLSTITGKPISITKLQDQIFVKFIVKDNDKKLSVALPVDIQANASVDKVEFEVAPRRHIESEVIPNQSNIEIETAPHQSVIKLSFTTKPRILIVDNDPRARISYQTLLMYWDYEPVLAIGTGEALLSDAKNKAYQIRCSLALIELRLFNSDDEEDVSGLKLADELSDVLRPIIFSGFDDVNVLRTILRKHKDITFISKHEAREAIHEILDSEAAKVTASKRNLVFENPEMLNEIEQSVLGQYTGGYPDQIADVFARLFPRATKLKLEKLEIRPASSNVSTVPRPNSVILKVYEEDYEPLIVKLARAKKIQKEVENYNQFISRRLTGSFSARMERSSILWDIGAICYSYLGSNDVKTFSRFCEERPITDIEESLSSFFAQVWGRNYAQARDLIDVTQFKLYSDAWAGWYEKLTKKYIDGDLQGSYALNQKLKLPEPIKWFIENVAESHNDLDIGRTTRVAITHGDLQGDNLLVDNKNDAWVIDFEHSGEGYILQDFISLEADIINRLEEHNDNLSEYFKMCIAILKQKKIQGFEKSETRSKDLRVEKTLQTISILRSLALQQTKITDAREYLLGLLFNVLFSAAIVQGVNPKQRRRNLMLAGLICHRLDHWDEPWPPAEWDTLRLT